MGLWAHLGLGPTAQPPRPAGGHAVGMGRLAAWLLAAAGAASLCACDQSGAGAAAEGGGSAAPTALSAPEPARFAKPGPPAPEPNAAALPSARQAASLLPTSGARPASEETAAVRAGAGFDGGRVSLASVTAPARAPGRRPAVRTLADRPMAIDTDGLTRDAASRRWVKSHDRWHQNRTALAAGGLPLDATVVPYISIPGDYRGARVGDIALVTYRGRRSYAVIGDVGPDGRFGEGSVALARRLGISADGNTGGASGGVTYTLFSGARADTSSQQALLSDLERRGPQLAAAAGLAEAPVQLASL